MVNRSIHAYYILFFTCHNLWGQVVAFPLATIKSEQNQDKNIELPATSEVNHFRKFNTEIAEGSNQKIANAGIMEFDDEELKTPNEHETVLRRM